MRNCHTRRPQYNRPFTGRPFETTQHCRCPIPPEHTGKISHRRRVLNLSIPTPAKLKEEKTTLPRDPEGTVGNETTFDLNEIEQRMRKAK